MLLSLSSAPLRELRQPLKALRLGVAVEEAREEEAEARLVTREREEGAEASAGLLFVLAVGSVVVCGGGGGAVAKEEEDKEEEEEEEVVAMGAEVVAVAVGVAA